MAKQYICKVCGYVHTGDKAPSVCPQCQQTDCFEPVKSKGLDTNSNVYTIIYASVVVVVVAVLLAVISQVLSPRQEANKRLDVQKQILTALNVNYDKADPAALYDEYVKEDEWDGKPVFYATIDNNNYTVLPLKGQGLWGGIWGYIALEDDLNTVYGINFGHESETPGLGAEIVTEKFRSQFFGKHIKDAQGNLRSIAVLKEGKTAEEGQEQVDAWAGATITSTGVSDMLATNLQEYSTFLMESNACCKEQTTCGQCRCENCNDNCKDCCMEGCDKCCQNGCKDCTCCNGGQKCCQSNEKCCKQEQVNEKED